MKTDGNRFMAKGICQNQKVLKKRITQSGKTALKSDRKILDTNKFTLAYLDWLEEKKDH
jgi:hypothetical protein